MQDDVVVCTDVSRLLRPEAVFSTNKAPDAFRNYESVGGIHDRVRRTYHLMHTHQTMQFSQGKVIFFFFFILLLELEIKMRWGKIMICYWRR